jgi:hypothetical protein
MSIDQVSKAEGGNFAQPASVHNKRIIVCCDGEFPSPVAKQRWLSPLCFVALGLLSALDSSE